MTSRPRDHRNGASETGIRRPFLVLVGPSGAGKSSVARELHRLGIVHLHPTWTTRPPRPDEAAGCPEHRFVDDQLFSRLSKERFFMAEGAIAGLPYRYGLPAIHRAAKGPLDAVILRATHVGLLRDLVDDCLVYGIADRRSRTNVRLASRGTDAVEEAVRRDDNELEVTRGRAVADRVFWNDDSLRRVTYEVAAALAADRGLWPSGRSTRPGEKGAA